MYGVPVLCPASAALSENKPLLTHMSTGAVAFPFLLHPGWKLDMGKSSLGTGSFVLYFNGNRILLARSKGKALA